MPRESHGPAFILRKSGRPAIKRGNTRAGRNHGRSSGPDHGQHTKDPVSVTSYRGNRPLRGLRSSNGIARGGHEGVKAFGVAVRASEGTGKILVPGGAVAEQNERNEKSEAANGVGGEGGGGNKTKKKKKSRMQELTPAILARGVILFISEP